MRKRLVFPAGAAVALTLVALFYVSRKHEVAPADIEVTGAWARATPPGASVGAVYLTIANKGGTADRLVSVASPAAQSAMLHQTVEQGGVSTMSEAGGNIAPGSTFDMHPGGAHIMLMGLSSPLKAGETIEVTLDFQNSGELRTAAKIEALGANAASQ
jgi:copper(I)-binding protein